MKRASLCLVVGLLLAPDVSARELTPEELRRMPRPEELPPEELPAEEEAEALPAEPLPVLAHRWPQPDSFRGTVLLGTSGEQARWSMGLGGRPHPQLGWYVEAYHRVESPDVYGLRAVGSWRSAPGLLLEGSLRREVLGREGLEAEWVALGAWQLGSLSLFAGPAAGARLSSVSHGVAGAAALLQLGAFSLRYDYRLQWTRLRLEGSSHLLQLGWMSHGGLLVATRVLRAEEPPDVWQGPRWRCEELSVLLDVPVTSALALQAQTLLGRRFEPDQPRPALSPGWALGLALSF